MVNFPSDRSYTSVITLLDEKALVYNNPSFIPNDPISIPHQFKKKQDIEIIGLWVALLSWGQRVTIINKGNELCQIMENQPHDFIMNASPKELKKMEQFKHRTFNGADALCFLAFFKWYYLRYESLEDAFLPLTSEDGSGIQRFGKMFYQFPDFLDRTRKHVANPLKNSSCKRINMFLRWMVRKDNQGVDFGLWERLSPSDLMIPLDVHVQRVALQLGILQREKADWKAVIELTSFLRKLDRDDPVKYDYALFGMGIEQRKNQKLSI